MNKKYIITIVWTAFILLNAIILKNVAIKKNTLDSYFRLHVVANSNSVQDQTIKMNVVRDVGNKINEILNFSNNNSKSDVKKTIENNVSNILLAANNSLKNQQVDDTANIKIGNIYYDERTKDNIYMNAGIYDSIQVVIGEGNGKNFWSLIYPYSYAGIYELNKDFLGNNKYVAKDIDNNTIITTKDIISSDNVHYKSGILEFAKKMWFN